MFKTFEQYEDLMAEVRLDQRLEGEGASTADRFPIRFVLFDNFRDCCHFVRDMLHDSDNPICQIVRMESWMDKDYPNSLLSRDKIVKELKLLVKENPEEYRILMPFSELARFYNNNVGHEEFNALINTIKSIDTSKTGYAHRQRVYIPIVGLEGKMRRFREDPQSFIWYFNNENQQLEYRLILTDNDTFGVQKLDEDYHIADTVTTWLKSWQYPELKEKIICTSHAIFAHADYAQPDNAFSYAVCHNTYEFLVKGLCLDLQNIPYREEESQYWDKLAQLIDIRNFKFTKFFNQQFGIYELQDYHVFFEQWFNHKDSFMRWLLAKYYTIRFCNEGYICRVLQQIESYNDTMFANRLALTIFNLDEPEKYLEERMIGLKIAAQKGIELAPEIQKNLVSHIEQIEAQSGVLSAIPYVSLISDAEKQLIIKWYREDKINKDQLRELYPDLYYYLQPTIATTDQAWILDYIQAYKEAKVRNVYSEAVKQFISEKNANDLEHFKWSNELNYTRSILNSRDDISSYCWIDGLGIDWIPYIMQIVKEHEMENYYVNEVMIAKAKLPSRTDNNKAELLALCGDSPMIKKYGDIDEDAHSCRPYPQFVIKDLDSVRKAIHQILQEHPGEKIAIVSDHGMTYLSQLCDGYNLKGFKSDHYGRCAFFTSNQALVRDDKYVIVPTDDGKQRQIVALRHESLMASIPKGMGSHGGATPEEELVPILIISNQKEKAKWSAKQVSFELSEAEPIFRVEISALDNGVVPVIEYAGKTYKLQKQGVEYSSERLSLDKDVKKVILRVGTQTKEFTVDIKLAVQEDDLFGDLF